jgi:hypothetical protein
MKDKLYTSITFTLLLLCSAAVMQAQEQSVNHQKQKPKLKLEAVEVVYPKEGKQVLIYPNPASSSITINTDEIDERPLVIEIYNDGGHRIYRQNWKEEALDISMLKPGIYFLKLKTRKETYTQKLIITR